MPGVHEQRPGQLADPQSRRGQGLFAVTPGPELIVAEACPYAAPEPPRVTAVAAPRGQPRAQLVIVGQHGPVPQPLGDLARRVDDEGVIASDPGNLDAVDAALAGPAVAGGTVADADGAEPGSDLQRRDGMSRLVPGRPHRRPPGGREA